MVSPPSTTSTPTTAPQPSLQLVKTAGTPVDVNDSGITDAGDTIDYTFTVTNTGNVPIDDVDIDDDLLTGPVTCAPTRLVPGAGATCDAAPYVVTDSDELAGAVANVATATGVDPDGDPVRSAEATTTTPTPQAVPAMTMDKLAAAPVDVDGNGRLDAGDTVAYTFAVTNTGNVPLADVTVTDPMVGQVTCPAGRLAVDATVVCTAAPYVITRADADRGSIVNTASATAVDPDGDQLDPVTDSLTITTSSLMSLAFDKQAAAPVDANGTGRTDPGDTIGYAFTVTNTGSVTVTSVAVADTRLTGLTCTPSTLAEGESAECTASPYVITQADIEAGAVDNVASATALGAAGTPVAGQQVASGADATSTPLEQVPALQLGKSADLRDRDGDNRADARERVDYTFTVINTGTIRVDDVSVDDPMLRATGGAIVCPVTTLDPGQATECTATYVVRKADTDGPLRNVARATGDSADGAVLSAEDEAVVAVDRTTGGGGGGGGDDDGDGDGDVDGDGDGTAAAAVVMKTTETVAAFPTPAACRWRWSSSGWPCWGAESPWSPQPGGGAVERKALDVRTCPAGRLGPGAEPAPRRVQRRRLRARR